MTNIDQIHNHVYRYVINQNAFFEVCPIPLDELLGSSRVQRQSRLEMKMKFLSL